VFAGLYYLNAAALLTQVIRLLLLRSPALSGREALLRGSHTAAVKIKSGTKFRVKVWELN
jgi:hypothetical protein